jgi:hypothetical protein
MKKKHFMFDVILNQKRYYMYLLRLLTQVEKYGPYLNRIYESVLKKHVHTLSRYEKRIFFYIFIKNKQKI